MQKIQFRNARGQELDFMAHDPYVLWKVDGIGLTETEAVFTQSAGQHGYTLHDVLTESRVVTLTGHVLDSSGNVKSMYQNRRELNNILNPVLGIGLLTYVNDAITVAIPAFCKNIDYSDKQHHVQTLTLNFECPSPFWEDKDYTKHSLAYVEGGLQFPLETPNKFGVLDYRVYVENTGDLPAPIQMYVDGGAVNPTITNVTTGEFIKIERETHVYEQIYIETDPEKSVVEIIRDEGAGSATVENAYGYLSFDSTLFTLAPGINELLFTSDDENKKVKIAISYKNLYAGV